MKAPLRAAHSLPDDAGVVLGNGSDELLQLSRPRWRSPGAAVVAPDPSFVMYRLYATLRGARFVGVPLRADFTLDDDAMLAAIERERPALVWLASPNNPTGNAVRAATVERIVRAAPGLAVVDEAYFAFAPHSFLPRVLEFPNLVVVRTLSKIGMAGLRLGYAVAHRAWIDEIDKVALAVQRQFADAGGCGSAARATAACSPSTPRDPRASATRRGAPRWPPARRHRLPTARPTSSSRAFRTAPRAFATLQDAGILVKNVHGWHPLLRELPAHHPRHAGRERRAACRAGTTNELMPTAPREHRQPRTAKVERNTAETKIAVELNLDGTRRAPTSRPACRSSTTCSTRSGATA